MNSVKKSIIMAYSQVGELHEDFKKNQITLITAAGTIIGKAYKPYNKADNVDFDDFDSAADAIARTLIESMNKVAIEQSLPEEERSPLDGFILLEDVQMISHNGSTSSFQFLTVFYDQIIAVTVGNNNADA